jgi:hypothetical protein
METCRSASLRDGLRRKEDFLLRFTARVNSCPDTCVVDGCDVEVQADGGRIAL